MRNSRSDFEYGKVAYICFDQRGGKDFGSAPITLTLIAPGDEELLAGKGIRQLRHVRIIRLTAEAEEQGALLNYLDLSELLLTSLATLKRDVAYLEAEGASIPLRGRRRNTRLGQLAASGAADVGFSIAGREGD